MSNSVRPQRRQCTRLPRPWDSPGKNTGVGCHFLLQCMKVKVKSLSQVLLFATPWTAAHQAPPSMGFPRQEYWSELPLPSPLFYLLSDFFFVFSFYQFYCLLCLGTDFLGDYCVWVLCASQICMYIVSVIKFGKFSAILFSSALFSCSFYNASDTKLRPFSIPEVLEALCFFSSLLFRADNFYQSVCKFTDFLLSPPFCLLSPSSELFQLLYCKCKSKIYIWFGFFAETFSFSLLKCLI